MVDSVSFEYCFLWECFDNAKNRGNGLRGRRWSSPYRFFYYCILFFCLILLPYSTWHKTPGLLRLNFSNTRILQTFAYKTRFQGNIVYCLGHNAFALMWPFDRCADIIIIRKNGFCTSKTSVKHGCCMGAMFDIVGIEIGNRAARHIFH